MAVYTHLTDSEIAEFLSRFGVGALVSAKGISEGIDNTNYLLTLEGQKKYILTIFEQRIKPQELPYFMGLTAHLAASGIPCPQPVEAKDGKVLHTLHGKPAALVHFLEGKNNPVITPAHMQQVGALLARMHLAGADYAGSRANSLSLDGWQALYDKFSSRADEIYTGLAKDFAGELALLRAHWPQGLPQGAVHGDVFPDNVFFEGEGQSARLSGIIDFYFACTDMWAYDLMIVYNAWCFDAQCNPLQDRVDALRAGYNSVRPISQAELEAMPLLGRAAAMRFLATRAHDWLFRVDGAFVTPKDPMEYVRKLRYWQAKA